MADPVATVRENALHGYANWTYNLQLWCITKDNFNLISSGSIKIGSEPNLLKGASQLLISNGGVNKSAEPRSTEFPTDFVIENLEIQSLVGNKGPDARGADALSLKFEIIEPYTVSLLDRLIKLSYSMGMGADFKTLIYCMKIQFFGYDDMGVAQEIPNTTKWIPFTLLNMHFNITNKGAVYQCEGVPVQNLVMTQLDNVVPFHVELKGQKVSDLFNATLAKPPTAATTSAGTTARSDAPPEPPNNNNTTITQGIAQAMNDNELFKAKKSKAQQYENIYAFEFDEAIGNATIVDPAKMLDAAREFATTKGTAGQKNAADGRAGKLTLDTKTGTFRAQAGTKITDLIGAVLKVSSYMRDQVSETGQGDPNKPLKMWKIIPRLEIMNYDDKTNFWQRKVTYMVKQFDYYGEAHPELPQQTPPATSLVKKYDYMFTGQNKDVIKVNLDFKIAFFEVRNGMKVNTVERAANGTGQDDGNVVTEPPAQQDRRDFKPGIMQVNGDASQANTGAADGDRKSIVIGEMMSKLLDNGVDLMALEIEIVGDPDWIQQDNVLYGPNVPSGAKTLSNRVINYQDSVTCFQFTFKSPLKDYDDTTGLFDLSNSNTAIFSGIYQIIRVTSSFRNGIFTQKLDNVRVPKQKPSDTKSSATAKTATVDPQPVITEQVAQTPQNQGQPVYDEMGNFTGIYTEVVTPPKK
jgi:hypothetical protein